MNKITNLVMRLDFNLAGKILIGICSVLIAFHTANYLGKIPLNITWLGRVDSENKIQIMSLVSIILNAIIIVCALVKCKYIDNTRMASIVEMALPVVFWWLVGNSVANLFSKSMFEVVAFTPLLVVLTVCVYVLKNTDSSNIR